MLSISRFISIYGIRIHVPLYILHNNYLCKIKFDRGCLKYTCVRQATYWWEAHDSVHTKFSHSCKNDNSRRSRNYICACRTRIANQLGVFAGLFVVRSRRAKQTKESCMSITFFRMLTLSSAFFGHFLLTEKVSMSCRVWGEVEGVFFSSESNRGSHCRYARPLNSGTIIPIVTGVTQELRRL